MDTGNVGGGPDGIQSVRPTPHQPRHGHRSVSGAMAVPEAYVRTWEGAYRQYAQVSEMAGRMHADDPAVAWHMATASWAVASAWRDLAAVGRLPWWALAAVESAAEAFESQARHWEAKERGDEQAEEGSP